MASINDLATAATIASSAVALQSSPDSNQESPRPAESSTAAPTTTTTTTSPPPPDLTQTEVAALLAATGSRPTTAKTDADDTKDGDSITVATGAPPVLAPPQIAPPQSASQAQAQIPAPPPPAAPRAASAEPKDENGGLEGSSKGTATSDGDAMDGVEETSKERTKPVRGALVVFEGMDRAGKTTQAKLLQQRCVESGREVRFMRFPDRTTPIGRMIDAYLKGETEVEDHVIHLLFSANRWEAVKKIKTELEAGHTIICDRFYHSGIVYSAAKEIKDLSLSWAKAPEVGLPRPDMVLFLDLEEEVARKRGGWGGEVYEKGEMQRRVRDLFWGLSMGDLGSAGVNSSAKAMRRRTDGERFGNGLNDTNEEGEFRQEEEDIQIVDANLDVESLSEKVWEHVLPRLEAVERGEVGKTVRIVR
ncbi:thymidylate kinase-domain-containing protein [Hypoxylon trugodes]|uniref:thymidylate kinase-domain-containing protein n=1 Tax=Hypoxylon trugodes TaxID=326681 RepID=UPI00218CDB22|nr:thymidylate kinase-domain-containing protein [Hypoxylon trugodes]KAI1390782.1 thymidylate kinase-domain-containing protein [Hypoxylon trugodes]